MQYSFKPTERFNLLDGCLIINRTQQRQLLVAFVLLVFSLSIGGLDWWLWELGFNLRKQVLLSEATKNMVVDSPPAAADESADILVSEDCLVVTRQLATSRQLQLQRQQWQQIIQAVAPYLGSGRLHKLVLDQHGGNCSGTVASWGGLSRLNSYFTSRLTKFELMDSYWKDNQIFFTSGWVIE